MEAEQRERARGDGGRINAESNKGKCERKNKHMREQEIAPGEVMGCF